MRRQPLVTLLLLVPLLGGSLLLSGCGQKGPLYLESPAEQAEKAEQKEEKE